MKLMLFYSDHIKRISTHCWFLFKGKGFLKCVCLFPFYALRETKVIFLVVGIFVSSRYVFFLEENKLLKLNCISLKKKKKLNKVLILWDFLYTFSQNSVITNSLNNISLHDYIYMALNLCAGLSNNVSLSACISTRHSKVNCNQAGCKYAQLLLKNLKFWEISFLTKLTKVSVLLYNMLW